MRLRSRGTAGKMVGCRVFMSSGNNRTSPWKNPTLAPTPKTTVYIKNRKHVSISSQRGLKIQPHRCSVLTCTILSNMCAKGRNEMVTSSVDGMMDDWGTFKKKKKEGSGELKPNITRVRVKIWKPTHLKGFDDSSSISNNVLVGQHGSFRVSLKTKSFS